MATKDSVKYHRLDQKELPTKELSKKCPKWPKLTRFHVTAASCFLVIFIVLLVYSSTNTFHLTTTTICSNSKTKLKPITELPPKHPQKERHPLHTKRRLPQCIIIGVRKGGTRALLRFLNLHPNIQIAGREIHFFDDDHNYSLGYDWYRKKMPFTYSDQITMEKTPAYFVEESVPERVWAMNHSISLLLVVRDPVERAVSDYAQLMYNKIKRQRPFKRFEYNAIDEDGEVNVHYAPIRRSVYHRHMARWLTFFRREQFLILSAEDLVQDPLSVIYQVEDFLGLEHRVNQQSFYYNETRGFYCVREESSEKCLSESKGRPHPEINAHVISKLRQYFHSHNEKFFKMVGQRFNNWQRHHP